MSPKKVDKEQKRKEIALACADLIHDMGIKKMTVSQVAKTAGIGKGTVYEYFENKEDIVFEIINIHINNYHKEFLESIKFAKTTKDKIKHFFKFVLDNSEANLRHFNGYKEYLSIVLSDENSKMKDFNCKTSGFFKEQLSIVIEAGIKKGELIPEALDLVNGIFIFEKGLILLKMSENNYSPIEDFEKFIDTIFKFIEVKK
ncbi:MAG: TetR family transcriptional regulator [Arcobacter sp.]|nr:MAG: TetR family transcriptional regulator [Arcobacter sp.]